MNSLRGVLQHYYYIFYEQCSMSLFIIYNVLLLMAKCYQTTSNQFVSDVDNFHFQNDYYTIGGVSGQCPNEFIASGRSYVDVNIDISNCYFIRYSTFTAGKGGIIYVSASSYSMNINYSMFYNCACSSWGGAIYFSSSNSYLRMICANSCSCGTCFSGGCNCGHFASLSASQMNQVEYLSVSKCSHTTSGKESISLYSGNQRVDNTNSSMNNAERVSGIDISSPSSFTSSYCTFSNNKVKYNTCIYFSSTSGTISMSYANIVHNNSPSLDIFSGGVVYVSGTGSRKMMYCIFKNNQNTLFFVYEGSLEVSHSFIDHTGTFSYKTSVSTSTNNSFTNRITYQLPFFKLLYCFADNPISEATPARSYVEHSQIQTAFPIHTPFNTHYPVQTVYQSLFPPRTNERSFPLDYQEVINYCNQNSCQMMNYRDISIVFSYSYVLSLVIIMLN